MNLKNEEPTIFITLNLSWENIDICLGYSQETTMFNDVILMCLQLYRQPLKIVKEGYTYLVHMYFTVRRTYNLVLYERAFELR